MKKIIKFSACSLLAISLSVLSLSCKKDTVTLPVAKNTAVIKLDNAQPTVDSVITHVQTNNSFVNAINIAAYLNHNALSYVNVNLSFSPSDPLYASGATINLASSSSASVYYSPNSFGLGNFYDNFASPPSAGIVTIIKNDPAARRIEGTLSNCVATSIFGGTSISISGSFAVTY